MSFGSKTLLSAVGGNWVLGPANLEQWHREVLRWLDAHLRAEP